MNATLRHNHDDYGAPTYPLYRDRCLSGCDDLTPVRMAETNVQYNGPTRLVSRRLVPDGPSRFVKQNHEPDCLVGYAACTCRAVSKP